MTDIHARIERIQQMEVRLNRLDELVERVSLAVEELSGALPELSQLLAYYQSLWQQDYAADARREVPQDMPRGVLSEDAVWNLLTEVRELSERMKEVSEEMV